MLCILKGKRQLSLRLSKTTFMGYLALTYPYGKDQQKPNQYFFSTHIMFLKLIFIGF